MSALTPEFLDAGRRMHARMAELYPICRSITGNGLRQTLSEIARDIPLEIVEVPTGTAAFDWTVPKEWNIDDAYVKNSRGERVIDFRRSSLHVVNYSAPVHAHMSLDELRPHLHSRPDQPDVVPYVTSYYRETWGFCLSHRQLLSLPDDRYEVYVGSSLSDGSLTYGEAFLPGATDDEVLISAHVCHPSLCNDNLSGMMVAAFLARRIAATRRRHSYRFLFIPGTIGAITWLSRNRSSVGRISHGLVLTCIGDRGGFSYKASRRGNAAIDRIVRVVLKELGDQHQTFDFSPYGYDERQYCSPGFDLPVGCLMRSVWGQFPEYHTSADALDFVTAEALGRSLQACAAIADAIDADRAYQNLNPFCEPQLGRRGLYAAGDAALNMARLWMLNLSDGRHTLLDIAERSGIGMSALAAAAAELESGGLLRAIDDFSR